MGGGQVHRWRKKGSEEGVGGGDDSTPGLRFKEESGRGNPGGEKVEKKPEGRPGGEGAGDAPGFPWRLPTTSRSSGRFRV